MIKRCPKCTGKKTIMGLGCIIHKCPECKGVGHIMIEKIENPLHAVEIETQSAKELKDNIENKSADVVKIDRRKKEFRTR